VDWFNRGNPICKYGPTIDKNYLEELRKPAVNGFDRLRMEFPTVQVFDSLPILCPEEECLAFDDKGPIVFDADHLSGHANDLLQPAFWGLVSQLIRHPSIQNSVPFRN
jgi:SGNH domain (fused to AT3 domains)